MTILNPSPIIEKLEEDGVEIVKAKKAKGLYRDEKLPLINRWLAEKAMDEAKAIDPEKSIPIDDPEEVVDNGRGWDAETLELAKSTDEEYKAADLATKRKITMARKKIAAAKD